MTNPSHTLSTTTAVSIPSTLTALLSRDINIVDAFSVLVHTPIGYMHVIYIKDRQNAVFLWRCQWLDLDHGTSSLYDHDLLIPRGYQTPHDITMRYLQAYFHGSTQLPAAPWLYTQQATLFQQKCWQFLRTIPPGTTLSYADQAVSIGHPKSYRAVGSANSANPWPIIIPCHRIIRKNGKLSGYRSGQWRKQWLLDHESSMTLSL